MPQGLGTLTVKNGHRHDAVVGLVEERRPTLLAHEVYVRTGETTTISAITAGSYIL